MEPMKRIPNFNEEEMTVIIREVSERRNIVITDKLDGTKVTKETTEKA